MYNKLIENLTIQLGKLCVNLIIKGKLEHLGLFFFHFSPTNFSHHRLIRLKMPHLTLDIDPETPYAHIINWNLFATFNFTVLRWNSFCNILIKISVQWTELDVFVA